MPKATAGMRRVREGEPGSDVLVVPIPIGLASVPLAREIEREVRLSGDPVEHVAAALQEPVVQVDRGRRLVAVRLVRRLQQRVTEAVGKYEIGGDPPFVLEIQLGLDAVKVARNEAAGG